MMVLLAFVLIGNGALSAGVTEQKARFEQYKAELRQDPALTHLVFQPAGSRFRVCLV